MNRKGPCLLWILPAKARSWQGGLGTRGSFASGSKHGGKLMHCDTKQPLCEVPGAAMTNGRTHLTWSSPLPRSSKYSRSRFMTTS